MRFSATTEDAMHLMHRGAIALAEVESNGIAVDTAYLKKATRQTNEKIADLESVREKTGVARTWRQLYRSKTNFESTEQLARVLYSEIGYTTDRITASGKFATDEKALSGIDDPFVKTHLEIKKLQKVVSTSFQGILREVVNGRIHCFYNLHTARTYRSSSDSINFQNQYARDFELSRLVRMAFIASCGNQLIEADLSGAEVRQATCYHRDPTMIAYNLNPKKDMHRDMAKQIFFLPSDHFKGDNEKKSKPIRQTAKNAFVFASFYGDWHGSTAKGMWEQIEQYDLKTCEGVPLKKWLRQHGIRELGSTDTKQQAGPGTFVEHIRKVDHDFWNNRFPVYNQWRNNWYEAYLRKGYFHTLTGFTCRGYMRRNEVINYPVQGSSFHCLLWSMIRVMDILKKRKMRSKIVGQIHDSMLGDVVPAERDEYLGIVHDVITRQLKNHYSDWMIVPMEVEADVSPVGGSWADKAKYSLN